ncbi:hypothetical protein ACU686_41580 [Yinghuangia aomiensis]
MYAVAAIGVCVFNSTICTPRGPWRRSDPRTTSHADARCTCIRTRNCSGVG